jgi:hypothetical protein
MHIKLLNCAATLLVMSFSLSQYSSANCAATAAETRRERDLWEIMESPQVRFKDAIIAVHELRSIYMQQQAEDPSLTHKFKAVVDNLSSLVKREYEHAAKLFASSLFSEASNVVSELLESDTGFLDKKSRQILTAQLMTYRYREALVGTYGWKSLAIDISEAEDRDDLERGQFTYYKEMALVNEVNREAAEVTYPYMMESLRNPRPHHLHPHHQQVWVGGQGEGLDSHTPSPSLPPPPPLPYVLSFDIPQHAQTPSLGHFGHVSCLSNCKSLSIYISIYLSNHLSLYLAIYLAIYLIISVSLSL